MSDPQPQTTFIAPEIDQLAPLFPGYTISHLIATGGMGAVYSAIQKSLDRQVAIKILPHEFSKDAAFCAGFEAEAKAMARLNHPNLIGVYDFGEVNGMLFIVMEFVDGNSLFHSAQGIHVDPAEVIRLITKVCNGLAHAHESGILHRDIKPANILLDLTAEPKIGDFGLARPVENKVQEGEEIFGTPHYTAPEVVSAPQSVDNRADIFSVGVMIHELLTGKLPADDSRSASQISQCDPRFDAIIRRATNPIPEARYNSASQIAAELHAIETSAGPRVLRTNSPTPGAARPARIRRTPLASSKNSNAPVVIGIVLAIVLVVLTYIFFSNKQAPPEPVTPDETTNIPDEIDEPAVVPPVVIEPDTRLEPDTPLEPEIVDITESDPDTMPDPDENLTDPEDIPPPKFGVYAFFTLARDIMRERAAPLAEKHKNDLVKNLAGYEASFKRPIQQLSAIRDRTDANSQLAIIIKDYAKRGNRIDDTADEDLAEIVDFENIHDSYLGKQETLDEALIKALSELSDTYILGLEKQIERLKETDDHGATHLIQEEIKSTLQDPDYFKVLMLGEEPEDEDEENDEEMDEDF